MSCRPNDGAGKENWQFDNQSKQVVFLFRSSFYLKDIETMFFVCSIEYYKITELVCAPSWVDSCVLMRVCKHSCDVLDLHLLVKIIL